MILKPKIPSQTYVLKNRGKICKLNLNIFGFSTTYLLEILEVKIRVAVSRITKETRKDRGLEQSFIRD